MLSCDETKNLLSAYYDGELGVAAAEQVAQHLCSCDKCQKALDDLGFVSSTFNEIDFPILDDAFKASLHEKLVKTQKILKPKNNLYKTIRPYIAVAACLVLVVGIYAAVERGNLFSNNTPITRSVSPVSVDTEDINQTSAPSYNNSIEKKEEKSPPPTHTQTKTPKIDNSAQNTKSSRTILPQTASADDKNDGSDLQTSTVDDGSDLQTSTVDGENTTSVDTPCATAQFILVDKEKREFVIDILSKYGTPSVTDTDVSIEILGTNYDACVDVLRTVDGINEQTKEEYKNSEYCYIFINL